MRFVEMRRSSGISLAVPAGGGGGSQPELVFASDWAAQLGTSSTARSDGGKWNSAEGDAASQEIIASTGLGFPASMAKVLKVIAPEPAVNAIGQTNSIPTPDVGGKLFWRFYLRSVVPDDAVPGDWEMHPVQVGNNAGVAQVGLWHNNVDFAFHPDGPVPADHWSAEIWTGDSVPRHWYVPFLQKTVTYRFEWMLHRVGSTTAKFEARIYGPDEVLLYGPEDFVDHEDNEGMTTYYTSNTEVLDTAHLQHFNNGHNGLGVGPYPEWHNIPLFYQGGFAVSLEDWIGPYVLGEAA